MACEKCWGDAYMRMLGQPSKSQAVHYQELLAEREEEPCTIWEREGLTHEEWLERERKNDERSLTDLLDDAQKAVDALEGIESEEHKLGELTTDEREDQ